MGNRWQAGAEWLRIRSAFGDREELGVPETVDETQVQLVVGYRIKYQH